MVSPDWSCYRGTIRGEVTPSLNDTTGCGFTYTCIPSAILQIIGPQASLCKNIAAPDLLERLLVEVVKGGMVGVVVYGGGGSRIFMTHWVANLYGADCILVHTQLVNTPLL